MSGGQRTISFLGNRPFGAEMLECRPARASSPIHHSTFAFTDPLNIAGCYVSRPKYPLDSDITRPATDGGFSGRAQVLPPDSWFPRQHPTPQMLIGNVVGYNIIALNHTISGKLPANHVRPSTPERPSVTGLLIHIL